MLRNFTTTTCENAYCHTRSFKKLAKNIDDTSSKNISLSKLHKLFPSMEKAIEEDSKVHHLSETSDFLEHAGVVILSCQLRKNNLNMLINCSIHSCDNTCCCDGSSCHSIKINNDDIHRQRLVL